MYSYGESDEGGRRVVDMMRGVAPFGTTPLLFLKTISIFLTLILPLKTGFYSNTSLSLYVSTDPQWGRRRRILLNFQASSTLVLLLLSL